MGKGRKQHWNTTQLSAPSTTCGTAGTWHHSTSVLHMCPQRNSPSVQLQPEWNGTYFLKNGDNTGALQSKSEVQNGTNQTVYKSRCTGKRTSTSPGCPESWVKSWTTVRASFNPARKLGNQPEGRGHRKTGASHRRHRRKEDEVTDLSGKASVDQNGWYGLEKQPSFKQPVSLSTAVSLCLSIKAQPLSTWTLLHETGWKNMQWRLFSFTI